MEDVFITGVGTAFGVWLKALVVLPYPRQTPAKQNMLAVLGTKTFLLGLENR